MISSKSNPKIAQIRALLTQRKARADAGEFVVEGVRLGEEAAAAGIAPTLALFTTSVSPRGGELIDAFQRMGAPVEEISESVMDSLSSTETSQGLLVVLPIPVLTVSKPPSFSVIADTIRDPGNLGTLLRSAAAAGVDEFIVTPGCADIWSPKVVRSGMGAHFRLPIRELEWAQISFSKGTVAFLADMDGAALWDTNLRDPLALIIGGEAEGASVAARKKATGRISIPMPGQSESLNAAVAGSILIFEVLRQRQK
jgi:TrmH family RNA methyltransferase